MTSPRRSRQWRRITVGVALFSLLLAACGSDDDDDSAGGGGGTLNISGPETGSEADGFTESFKPFTDETGVKINYSGSRDFETQIRVALEGGELPDIAVLPQPGLLRDLADRITPVPQSVLDAHRDQFDDYLWELATVDGTVLGVPNKGDVKSLVWYSPKVFEEKGYEIPETWDALIALQNKMKTDGIAPWCVGIESGEATGWPLTDWIEDLMLRVNGPDVYDQWVAHEIPFDDPRVKKVVEMVGEIWFTSGNVLNGRQSIASTGFAQAGVPITDGTCGMHRQANFYGAQFKEQNTDVKFGADGDVDIFYLPTVSDEFGKVTLSGGTYVVAFNDNKATLDALEFLASPEYANARVEANKGGFLSPNKAHDTALYAEELDRSLAEILITASPLRFDGSDLMPSDVGAGSFWREGTNWVLGTSDVDTFLRNVEASWPG